LSAEGTAMRGIVRHFGAVILLAGACAGIASAASPKEIEAAIARGADFLKSRYQNGAGAAGGAGGASDHGIGPTCLVGLALLESGTPVTDRSLQIITDRVRNDAYIQNRTYQTSLCLMYLDRLGDPADVPLIQALAVRLLVGQNGGGGWGYELCATPAAGDVQRLKSIKADQGPGKLHPEVERYGQALFAARAQGQAGAVMSDDNSNTQFAVLAVWLARKHGVPVESALDLIEQRFIRSQNLRTGGWSYSGGVGGAEGGPGSPSMHCAGLIGLATSVARREERRLKSDLPKKEEAPKKQHAEARKNPDDPFFNPPQKTAAPDSKKPAPARNDARDRAVSFALGGLGQILAESIRAGRGSLYLSNERTLGRHDLYFYWSLERVGVIFGLDKIGGVDWYGAGAHTLVHTQTQTGSWQSGNSDEIDTSFAILFLCKSNLARDLSSKVQKEVSTEMRAGAGPTSGTNPKPAGPGSSGDQSPLVTDPILPGVGGSEAAVLAGQLLRANEKDWPAVIKKLRDTKGPIHTQALLASVNRLDGDRRRLAREALAERLTRMTAQTLRAMLKDEEVELRRAAALAMAMKDERSHISDLVAALMDEEEVVVRAAKAGLKSLAGQDFGPGVNATAGEKKIAVSAWNDWLTKQKN
jgi:hypothetical protein